jgi:hypothetical protein
MAATEPIKEPRALRRLVSSLVPTPILSACERPFGKKDCSLSTEGHCLELQVILIFKDCFRTRQKESRDILCPKGFSSSKSPNISNQHLRSPNTKPRSMGAVPYERGALDNAFFWKAWLPARRSQLVRQTTALSAPKKVCNTCLTISG